VETLTFGKLMMEKNKLRNEKHGHAINMSILIEKELEIQTHYRGKDPTITVMYRTPKITYRIN